MQPHVLAVHRSSRHEFSKDTADEITLVEGWGVEGDAHAGVTVQHLYRMRTDPGAPNLRQVHLIHAELFDQIAATGHEVRPGDLGENITTRGLDLLALPTGTRLQMGDAVVLVTGLRNPCQQINDFQPGLLKQVLRKGADGSVQRLTGVMGVVERGGRVAPGVPITVRLPDGKHVPLAPV